MSQSIHQYRVVICNRKRNFQAHAMVLATNEVEASILLKGSMEKALCDYFKLSELPCAEHFWDDVQIQITEVTEARVLNFGWDRLTHGSVKVGCL